MKANCNDDWLTFRDEQHTRAYTIITKSNYDTRIHTNQNASKFILNISIRWVKTGTCYISSTLVILLSTWDRSMVLPWYTKKYFSNNLSSTSSSEAELGMEKEPEYVASWENRCCIPRYTPIWHLWSAQGWVENPRTFQKSSAIQMTLMMKYSWRSVIVSGNNIPGAGNPCIQASS